RLEHHLNARRVADEFIGPGADRVLAESLVADLRHITLRYDEPGGSGRGAVKGHEIRPGLVENEAHRERINDLDLANVGFEFSRARAFVTLETELHIFGGPLVAVVKLEPRAQFELVGQSVRALRP